MLQGIVDAAELETRPNPQAKKPAMPPMPTEMTGSNGTDTPPTVKPDKRADAARLLDRVDQRIVTARLAIRTHTAAMAEDHMRTFRTDMRRVTGLMDFALDEPYVPALLAKADDALHEELFAMPRRLGPTIARIIAEGRAAGWPDTRIRDAIDTAFDRAWQAAQDRTRARLYQQLDAMRQQRYGITHYIWRSRDDDHLRTAHAGNDDRIFAWGAPPATGHPGADYGCRCRAEPIASGRWA